MTRRASAGDRARLGVASFPGEDLEDVRFRRLIERFHALGPRPLAELLAELGAERLLRHVLEQRLAEYVDRLDPELVKALGADRLPPTPIHQITGAPQ